MLRVKDVQKSYGALPVLSDVSFSLERGQRVALVGQNGVGKTTLLRILAGIEKPDAGSVSTSERTRVGYLPQDTSLVESETVRTFLRKNSGIDVLEREMESTLSHLSDVKKTADYDEARMKYEAIDGYTFEHRMGVILSGFGLDNNVLEKSLTQLSSGQKSKVALAGILLTNPDLLLLDEPTNNLDLPALIWLEDFLKVSKTACIIISHDRRFLDRLVRKMFEIDWRSHALIVTSGTYSDYIERKRKELIRARHEYELQQEEIERLEERAKEIKSKSVKGSKWKGTDNDKMLRGFKRNQAGKSGQVAKTIEKRIEQMDKRERPIERKPFEIPLAIEKRHGSLNIDLVDVVAGYPRSFEVGPFSLSIRAGERLGIMGLNGSGKTTLLKTITGELPPLEGRLLVGAGVRIGNMMQEHESLPRDESLIDWLVKKSNLDEELAFNKLVRFGFDRLQVRREIGTLSPGGRARFLLAMFSALSVNTLVLDEPTNHLDIEALEALEETLESYEGTVILVSHDRYFVEKTGLDTVYTLSDGKLLKIFDYKVYIASAEERAKKLLKQWQ